jgi:alpha-methylacyl-CoA racemase
VKDQPLVKPLADTRIVEFEGIGPGPLAGLLLAQLGAEVVLISRPGKGALPDSLTSGINGTLHRNKRHVVLDLKVSTDRQQALDLIGRSDGLIEGNRPGVMERLGLGPADCARINPRLVYGRMTGWGQDGPLASAAGHDINYVALTGLMSLTERPGHPPMTPPTVLGDAVGALGLTLGMVSGLLSARNRAEGCVVDAAIVDVLAMLSPLVQLVRRGGELESPAPSIFHDSPFYDRYRCADGRYITIGAIEPKFYQVLLDLLGLTDLDPGHQMDRSQWPAIKSRIAEAFESQPRDFWVGVLEGTDACFAPVLNLAEAARHPHNLARGLYTVTDQGDIETARGLRLHPLSPTPTPR